MCIEAKNTGIKTIIVPKENAKEAAVVTRNRGNRSRKLI